MTKDVTRWVVMLQPCNPSLGMNYGYVGYVSYAQLPDTKLAYIAHNKAQNMPWATRVSGFKPCCKGKKFKNFKPCCHYRFDPTKIYMPSGWGEWSGLTSCSASCGGGVKSRSRTCHGKNCAGSETEEYQCNTTRCGGPLGWAQWSNWSECSLTCGGGVRYRERNCVDQCPLMRSFHKEPGRCNWFPCKIPNEWGEWGEWTECSATCELGKTWRTRECTGGPCLVRSDQAAPKQIKDCFSKYCNCK